MSPDTKSATPSSVAGSCLCGAVRFEVELPVKFCVHCHCSMCRRNHAAAFVTWFGAPKTGFRLLSDESLIARYRSSDHGLRSFCSRCGSSLFCELARDPDTIDITLASMQGPIDRSPQAHIYFDTHVEWVEFPDPLPKIGAV